jgi:hypothetical protein
MQRAATPAQGGHVLGFTDEELHSLTALASPLLPPMRDDFLRAVADRLAVYPVQLRGPGLVHRTAVAIITIF